MHSSIALVALMAAGTAVAKIIEIDVGKGGLTFSPDTVTADVGDTLEFHFFASIHTAVQGDFSTPCQRGSLESTGFNSGPIDNTAAGTPNVFQVTVKDTNPIWFYCSAPTHCQTGMAGVVNPPSSGNSLATYKANAAGASSSEGSSTVSGGQVVAVGTKPSSSAAAGGSSSSSSAPASSGSASSKASSASSGASSGVSASTQSSAAAGGSSSGVSTVAGSSGAGTTGTAATTAATTPATTSSAAVATATSGASGVQGWAFAARGTLAGLAVGVGMLAYLMA